MILNILLGFLGLFQLIIMLLYFPLFVIFPIILCVRRARKLYHSKILWGVLGFFFSYVAVLIAYLLPAKNT